MSATGGRAWGSLEPAGSSTGAPVSFEQFARNLLTHAITPERVATVIRAIAGERVEVGPLTFGPGGAASASGVAIVGPVWVGRATARTIGFDARIPSSLTLDLTVAGKQYRYQGPVEVRVSIAVELNAPAFVVLAVAPVRPADVTVKLQTTGMAAFVLQTLGDADGEVAIQVSKIVNEQVKAVDSLCRIDVAALLDQVWDTELADRILAVAKEG